MRWARSPESARSDSDRTMSLFWDISESAPGDRGHLSMLQLRLTKTAESAEGGCGGFCKVCTYIICLDRTPMLPLRCEGKGLILIGSLSCPGFGSSSRLGSLWVGPSFSGPSVELLSSRGWSEPGRSSGDCGLCSMVSWSGLVVSWITKFIWKERYGASGSCRSTVSLWVLSYEAYLVLCNVPDRNPINLQYPVPSMHG